MTAVRPDEAVAEVAALVGHTAALARTMGRDDIAAGLRTVSSAPGVHGVHVLVVGETQRGKSRLINALVGRADLLPVGEVATTGCYIELRRGDVPGAVVSHASVDPDGQLVVDRTAIGVDRIGDHARVGHTERVAGVEVELPVGVLTGLTLVDTPGLGTTDMARNRVTLAALDATDALLLVCDASQPILEPELRLLEHAARRLTAIAVVVTKTDRFPAHAEVVAETRARIAERPALRDVVVVPVSASTAERADVMERTDPLRAQLVRGISGMDALAAFLAGTRERAQLLPAANALRHVAGVVRTLTAVEAGSAAAVAQAPEQLAELVRRCEELQAQLGDEHAVRVEAHHFLQRMRVRPRHVFEQRVSELRRSYRDLALTGRASELAELPSRLEADIADGAQEALAELAAVYDLLDRHLSSRLGYDELRDVGGGEMGDAVEFDVSGSTDVPLSRNQRVLAALPGLRVGVLVGGSSSVIGAVGLGALVAPAVAVGLAAAVAVGWWSTRATTSRSQRTHLRAWSETVTSDARSVFARTVDDRVLAVQHHVDLTLPTLIRRRLAEIRTLQAEAASLTELDREHRARVRAEHERRTAELAELSRRAEGLRVAVARARAVGEVEP